MALLNSKLGLTYAPLEAAKAALASRSAQEAAAGELKKLSEQRSIPVGTTLNVRYQYRVGEDGALVPLNAQVVAGDPQEKGAARARRQSDREAEGRGPRFADIAQPKPQLLPSDELAVFAYDPTVLAVTANTTKPRTGEVVTPLVNPEEPSLDNESASRSPNRLVPSGGKLGESAQSVAAQLYARNNDVTYNTTPIAELAA